MAEIIKLYPENPNDKHLKHIMEVIESGGLIIYPTDTVYSFGCDITRPKTIERISQLKGIKLEKSEFSIIFNDLSHLSDYTKQVDTPTYKLLKKCLPGPFTFILEASNQVPKLFKAKRKTIGIRIPDHSIPRLLVEKLGRPLVASSVHDEDDIIEYTTNPELIKEKFDDKVDLIIDCGFGDNHASTVVDLTNGQVEILREGKGDIELL